MKNQFIVACLCLTLSGCGAAPVQGQSKTPSAKSSQTKKKQAPPNFGSHMAASLNKIAAARRARVVYAVFGGAELADNKGLQKQIVLGLHKTPEDLSQIRARLGKEPPVPLVITSPNDSELPIDLKTISAADDAIAKRINGAKFVAFLRYVGPEHPGQAQLWSSALSAALVASAKDHVVVDMATRESFDSQTWRKKLSGPDWLSKQVQPGAQKNEDGTVTFFTLGMMKFGRPDLEESAVPSADARQRFQGFTEAIQTVLDGKYVTVGDARDGLRFEKCTRSEAAIEHACVQIRRDKK